MVDYKIGGRLAGWLSGKNIVTLWPSFTPLGLDRSFLWAECDKKVHNILDKLLNSKINVMQN
jgi:hypothetical protein